MLNIAYAASPIEGLSAVYLDKITLCVQSSSLFRFFWMYGDLRIGIAGQRSKITAWVAGH